MDKYKVVFTPSGKRGEFSRNSNLLDIARSLGVDIDSVCGGRGICGRCQVEPSEGDFPKFKINARNKNLSSWSDTETEYQNKKGNIKDGRRLACCSMLKGDMVIDVPPDSQVHKQVIRKPVTKIDIEIKPITQVYQLNISNIDKRKNVKKNIIKLLSNEHSLNIKSFSDNINFDFNNTSDEIGVVVRNDRLIDILDNPKSDLYGFAVDLGSTTISCNLVRLKDGKVMASVGAMNPQIRFGEDLMSRVSYAMMNKGGDKEMTKVVRDTLSSLFSESIRDGLANMNETQAQQLIVETVIVGNPVMHHLFLGLSPLGLGFSPFDLEEENAVNKQVSDFGDLLNLNPNGFVYVLPCIAGHVGADAAAVALAVRPDKGEKRHLIVDVGTNAEIIFGNKDKLFACSSPTGPALEGAQIVCGQRAAPGAIERVRIDKKTLEPRFAVIGTELWSDEEEFNTSVKKIGVTGICGSGIIEVLAQMYLAGIISSDGIIDGDMASKTDRIIPNGRVFDYILHRPVNELDVEVRITQGDVRAIQLAKGALWAGCKIMEDYYGDKCEKISLAGAFGSHIDIKYALVLGLIPDCNMNEVSSIGNSAGSGARIALLNKDSRNEIENLVSKIEKIETALESSFQGYFVDAMAIPNNSDPYINLQQVVELPPKKLKVSSGGSSKSRTSRQNRRRRS